MLSQVAALFACAVVLAIVAVSCLCTHSSACVMCRYIYDLCTECYTPSTSDSLVIAITLKSRKKFLITTIL
jgi:hypothetical protein